MFSVLCLPRVLGSLHLVKEELKRVGGVIPH